MNRISTEQRLEWLALMPESNVPQEWIDTILEAKLPTVEVANCAEYLAVCKLDDAGKVIIRGYTNGNIGENGKGKFSLSYPDSEARTQTNLFDL